MCNYVLSLRLLQALVVAVHNLFHRKNLLAQSVPDGPQLLIPRRRSTPRNQTFFSDEHDALAGGERSFDGRHERVRAIDLRAEGYNAPAGKGPWSCVTRRSANP